MGRGSSRSRRRRRRLGLDAAGHESAPPGGRILVPGEAVASRDGGRGPACRFGIALAFLAVLALALYARQLFLGQTFVLRDHLIYTWTERKILADALRAGRIPEWNDLIGFGTQFAASSANGLTYPPLWIVGLLPLPLSMDVVVALHVLWSGVGTALLARRLGANALGTALAGAALVTCGYVASIAPNKIFVGTAWIPWVAWAADRAALAEGGAGAARLGERARAAGILAAVLGLQLLAGDPASSVTSGLVAAAVILARARRRAPALLGLAAASATALLLGAAGALPGLALLPHTSRAALSLSESTMWSLHPWRLLELVWPGVLGSAIDPRYDLAQSVAHTAWGALEPSWSFSVFLGAPVLALAALPALSGQRGSRGLWLGAAALLLLALGAYTPLYAAFRAAFPPERISRYPEKHLAGAIVIVCALAGAGLAELGRRRTRAAAWAFGVALAALALPLASLAVLRPRLSSWLQGATSLMVPPLDVEAALGLSLRSGATALCVAVAASALLLARARGAPGRIAGPLAVALLAAHAAWEGWSVTPVGPAERLSRPPALLQARLPPGGATLGSGPPPRILRSPHLDAEVPPDRQGEYRHETLFLDSVGRFGFAAVPGFEGWRSQEFAKLWGGVRGMPLGAFLELYAIDLVALPRELEPILSSPRPDSAAPVLAQLELDFAASDPSGGTFGFALARGERIRPRAFVAPRWRWTTAPDALPALLAPGRGADPGLVILTGMGGDAPAGPRDRLPLTPCDVTAYRAEQVGLRCASAAGGYAVLAEENAPGWTATVDGRAAPIATADVLLRAVPVPPGDHRIEFTYRTPLLRTGVAVSLLSWAALLALLAFPSPRPARRGSVP